MLSLIARLLKLPMLDSLAWLHDGLYVGPNVQPEDIKLCFEDTRLALHYGPLTYKLNRVEFDMLAHFGDFGAAQLVAPHLPPTMHEWLRGQPAGDSIDYADPAEEEGRGGSASGFG